jgi:hypothetical protein
VGRRRRRHWYRIYVGECPLCGADSGYKERVYGRPPGKWSKKRVVYLPATQTYDYCDRYGALR